MKYYSETQIAKRVNEFVSKEVTNKDIRKCLKKLEYIDCYNIPTPKALAYYSIGEFRGRKYLKWDEHIVEEIEEYFFERSWVQL